jgi:hypothetical protein
MSTGVERTTRTINRQAVENRCARPNVRRKCPTRPRGYDEKNVAILRRRLQTFDDIGAASNVEAQLQMIENFFVW